MLSLQDMRMIVMNEAKIVHGKTVIPKLPESILKEMAKQLVNEGKFKTEEEAMAALQKTDEDDIFSMSVNDTYTSFIQKQLESYDKQMDEAVLQSENIVAAYNAMNEARFDEAIKKVQEIDKIESEEDAKSAYTGLCRTIANGLKTMAAIYDGIREVDNINESELKKSLMSGLFYESDDPNKIRKMLQLRINYNNNMINLFKAMLQSNYRMLGFSKDEALLLSQQIVSDNQEERQKSIKTIKEALLANKKKFDRGNGIIDMRDIGAGVIFGTEKETGLDEFVSIDRMLQLSMKYDAIVFGHGSSVKADTSKEFQSALQKVDKMRQDVKKIEKENEALWKKIDEDSERYQKKYEAYANSKNPITVKRYDLYKHEIDNIKAIISKLKVRDKKLEAARSKAYDAYVEAKQRLIEQLKNGEIASKDEFDKKRKKIDDTYGAYYEKIKKI